MLCAISGEVAQIPVASAKNGNIFEKRLIEAYITENGKDPVTGEDLSIEDLIDLKPANIVRPRPPTLTSIPSLLSVFQNEWDALALETFTLRQHLTQTRQELSSALYENDAARRVIAKLSRERDEAREVLANVEVKGGQQDTSIGDGQGLPTDLVEKVNETQVNLSKTRRKRTVPVDWAATRDIEGFQPLEQSEPIDGPCQAIALNENNDLALLGGANLVGTYDFTTRGWVHTSSTKARITDVLWAGDVAVIALDSGTIKGLRKEKEIFEFTSHAGEVTALALHPCVQILASVGVDRTYVFYDLLSSSQILQGQTDSSLSAATFHPDGHIFAAGGIDCQIRIFDVKTGTEAANFTESGSIQSLAFSENGTWLAAAVKGSSSISVWDLRKGARLKVLETNGPINCVRFDYTGQYLACAGPSGISVQHYSKSSKQWSEPLRNGISATALEWGAKAQKLVSVDAKGSITVLGTV